MMSFNMKPSKRTPSKRTRSSVRAETNQPTAAATLTNPSSAKRPRLFRRISSTNLRAVKTTASASPAPGGTVVTSFSSFSSSSPKPLQSRDDNQLSLRPTEDIDNDRVVFKKELQATSDNIESALCIISDMNKKYTKPEIMASLKNLRRWAKSDDRYSFCNELLDLGGIPRFIKFLETGNAMADPDYICLVSSIISSCTFIRTGNSSPVYEEIGEKIARKFVERGGILTMLQANREFYRGGSKVSTMKALDCIWASIGNIISRKSVLDDIEKVQTLRIFDDAISTLRLLDSTTSDTTWGPRILVKVFSVLAFLSSCSPEASLVAADCKGKEVFQTCVAAIQGFADVGGGFDSQVWSTVSRFFVNCYNRLFFAINGHDDLVKTIIPFYVEYMKQAPNEAFEEGAFGFLCSAGEMIGKSLMAETPGIMSRLGDIMDSNNNDEIKRVTKMEAKKLLKYLL